MKRFLQKYILPVLRHGLCLLPALLAVILYWVLPYAPQLTEYGFARGIFRVISVPLGGLIAVLPLSLTEILAVAALPLVVFLLILFIRRMRRTGNRRKTAARAVKAVGWVLSGALLLYMVMHGANFYRLSVPELMGLDTAYQSPEYLQQVCKDLAQKASAEREQLAEDADGCMQLSQSMDETLRLANDGYTRLDDTYPFLWGGVWRAKPVQLSHWWSYTGITGMYFPMLAEANVNIDVPHSSIPATAAHELAHTRGFAREDECNFWGYLTSIHSESADYRYSGYLLAYIYCSNALYDYDKDLWSEARAACSDGMKRDLAEGNRYWKQFEGKVQDISTNVNNSFIQAQGVEDGVFSYSRVVQLIVGYYLQTGFILVSH